MKDKVCIIGSGNWGSAIATIIGPNVMKQQQQQQQHSQYLFEPIIHMWVYEELISSLPSRFISCKDGILPPPPTTTTTTTTTTSNSLTDEKTKTKYYKLTDIINTYHENIKYLPNITIPHNIVATSSIEVACHNATLIIFVLPHQYITSQLLLQIANSNLNRTHCRAISLIKGIDFDRNTNRPKLISHMIQDTLRQNGLPNFQCGVLMGANIANEVALQQHVCESTLACNFHDCHNVDINNNNNNTNDISISFNERTRILFHNENCFRIQHITDINMTEICGAIKNCIALGAGYIDGLQYGSNTKAALLRIGLFEMYHFATYFYPPNLSNNNNSNNNNSNVQYTTMMESCGVADLITTCYSGRNRACAELFAKERCRQQEIQQQHQAAGHTNSITNQKETMLETYQQYWKDIERRLLNGQKIQGVSTIYDVYHILHAHDRTRFFPLLTTIYNITFGIEPITSIVNGIRIYNNDNDSTTITTSEKTNQQRDHIIIPHQRSHL